MSQVLQVGCGPIRYTPLPNDHWTHIDREASHNPTHVMDCTSMGEHLTWNYFDSAFACHVVEHLDYPAGVVAFLGECRKVLKPGGTLRIVVPDLMKVARKYVAGEDLRDIYDGPFHYGRDCPAERFTYFCRAWEHTILFDEPLLKGLMEEAGFRDVMRMPHGVSRVESLCGVDRFESESMSLEGIK